MALIIDERMINVVTGRAYPIKRVGDRMAVLETEEKSNRILKTADHLKFFVR
jgi:hypothetical protein